MRSWPEFTLTDAEGGKLSPRPWSPYGVRPTLDQTGFITALARNAERAGLDVDQIHAEYGADQFEISLAPADPVATADSIVLARNVIGRAAARNGMLVSFSPVPYVGGSGNGAHPHLSLTADESPIFAGGSGPHGLTEADGSAIAGIVTALPALLGVYAGSVLSSMRLKPGSWAGAAACWGLENREAAVRFCAATRGNPHGANVELKCGDPSANPYLAAAALLGSAVHGIEGALPLPAEVPVDPASAVVEIPSLAVDQVTALDALAESEIARSVLGSSIIEALLSVRRYEAETFAHQSPEETIQALRLAWSC